MKNSTIEARVAHLEAQNRTLRRTGIALAALLGALPINPEGYANVSANGGRVSTK